MASYSWGFNLFITLVDCESVVIFINLVFNSDIVLLLLMFILVLFAHFLNFTNTK